MALRDHKPIVLEAFNGLWKRGDDDSCPIDHFTEAENISYIQGGFRTRDGLDTFGGIGNVVRLYNYTMQEGQSLLILNEDGEIFHAVSETLVYGPILSISGMQDFGMVSIAGMAYITPITRSITSQGQTREVGMEGEFVYVYKGKGEVARKAAGFSPVQDATNPHLVAYNSSVKGVIDEGIHIIAVSFSDGGGESTAAGPEIKPIIYAVGEQQAYVQNIPIGGGGTTERHIYMSKAIDPELYIQGQANGLAGIYELFLAKVIPDNTTISDIIDIADADLIVPFAAGGLPNPTAGGIVASNTDNEGYCDIGLHVIGVVYETDTGYLTAPGPEVMAVQSFVNENRSILVKNIPTTGDPSVVKRHLVSSKAILNYNGDDLGYQLYFIPDATLEDDDATELEISYYDIDLLDDASHLIDNFEEIPAGVTLTTYKGRMVLSTTHKDISICYLSAPGEPEAIDQVDGIIIVPLDGNPVTNAQEFRDVLYLFKQTRTYAVNDNGDVPSTWQPFAIDQGIGASVHGIGTVLDSGGVNIEYLLIVDYSGLMVFNGTYARPELTWKIQDAWLAMDRAFFGLIQIMNDSLNQLIYITLPSKRMFHANYANGLDAKNIRWAHWRFDIETTSIALINTDTLIIGAQDEAE